MKITWYGHSNFHLEESGFSLLIDPFFSGNPSCPPMPGGWGDLAVDMVLVTHDHGDHLGDAIAICQAKQALLGCVVGTGESLVEQGLDAALLPAGMGFNIGGTFAYKGVQVTMTEALHTSQTGTPVGYIVKFPNGFTLYHAGDTGIFSNMALLGELYPLDLALLPIGGFFTMDAYQAAKACKLLQPKLVAPMHYRTFPMLAQETYEFARELALASPKTKMLQLESGKSVIL